MKPRLLEAKAQVEDILRELEYMNAVWWPWGEQDRVVFEVHCGGTTILFREPEDGLDA